MRLPIDATTITYHRYRCCWILVSIPQPKSSQRMKWSAAPSGWLSGTSPRAWTFVAASLRVDS